MRTLFAIAALTLVATASPAQSASVYPVRLYSFGFQPAPIVLHAGVPVILILNNTAGMGHEFKAPYFFRTSRILTGSVGQDGSIELKPHQSASVTLIPARGTYELHCGHFMHKQLGMQTWIYVE